MSKSTINEPILKPMLLLRKILDEYLEIWADFGISQVYSQQILK